MNIFVVYVLRGRKVRRTFLTRAINVEKVIEIMHLLNNKEIADKEEPLFFGSEELSIEPVEFDQEIMEI